MSFNMAPARLDPRRLACSKMHPVRLQFYREDKKIGVVYRCTHEYGINTENVGRSIMFSRVHLGIVTAPNSKSAWNWEYSVSFPCT